MSTSQENTNSMPNPHKTVVCANFTLHARVDERFLEILSVNHWLKKIKEEIPDFLWHHFDQMTPVYETASLSIILHVFRSVSQDHEHDFRNFKNCELLPYFYLFFFGPIPHNTNPCPSWHEHKFVGWILL